jgi:hypothetical protein
VLGDTLLSSAAITAPQLEQALQQQRVTGALLGEALVALEFISEETLARALAAQAGVPFVTMATTQPDPAAARLVPERFARRHLLVPVELKGSMLHVVQANPLDVLALDDLGQFTARSIAVLCAPPDDVRVLLDRCYAPNKDAPRARRQPPQRARRLNAPRRADTPRAIVPGDAEVARTATLDADERRVRPLSELGFSRRDLGVVTELLNRARGLVLVASPDGAGTSMLYSMTTHLSGVSANIVTIEQAIESEIPGVRQTQLNAAAGLTSAAALRSILRQYPDVVMLSDIGEREAADMALRAAQSGILVLSTLTENDAASAVRRLVDMRLDPYLLASGLSAIVAQRLVRLICSECRERATYPADVLAQVGLAPDPDVLFSRGRGCAACGGTGYRGRTGAFEVVVPNDAVRMLIRQQADAGAIAQAAASARRNTVFDDAFAKAILQQTTLEEAVRLKATL